MLGRGGFKEKFREKAKYFVFKMNGPDSNRLK